MVDVLCLCIIYSSVIEIEVVYDQQEVEQQQVEALL